MPEDTPKRRKGDNGPPKIELTPVEDQPETFTVKLARGRIGTVKMLNGFEQLAADDYCGPSANGSRIVRTYGICILRKIDDVGVAPLSHPLQFETVSRQLRSRDTQILAQVYNQLEDSEEDGLALKNESSAAGV